MSAVIVPEELEKQLTPAGSRALAMFVNEAIRDERGNVLDLVEERFARRLAESEKRVLVEMAGLRTELRTDIAESEKRLDAKISELRVDMAESEKRLDGKISALEVKLEGKISGLEVKMEGKISGLEVKMAELRADVIKWSFIFWLTQMFAIAGLFLTR